MPDSWRIHIGATFADLNAALASDKEQALEHLQNAIDNLHRAVEELEGE